MVQSEHGHRVPTRYRTILQEKAAMDYAFFVVDRESGMFLFGSNVLSECIDMAQRHVRVEVVDMFGQIWGAN
jgi:hypothetical protein